MANKRRNFYLTFAVAVVLLVAVSGFLVAVTGNVPGARLDLTEDQLFTMSPAAVTILEDLAVPVQVKLYITPEARMPTEFKNLERDITEQLSNYERISGGQLQFSVHNPQDNEEMQQELMQKGIQPFQVQSVEKDEMGIKLIWSAMTIAYKDHADEVIPRMLPQQLRNLETMIIGPVHRLTRERDPKVAVFAPLVETDPQVASMYLQQGMQPPPPQDMYATVKQLLQQEHYAVQPIELTRESPIPADADLLLVLGPRNLNQRQAWEINRALSNGMPVIMAIQSHDYSYNPGRQGEWTITGQPLTSGLEEMLADLGLTVGTDHFCDANSTILELPREMNLGGLRMQVREPVEAPVQIIVTQDQVNEDQPITNHIGSLLYLWGTPIDQDPTVLGQHGLSSETLMTSSSRSWRADFGGGMLTPAMRDAQGQELVGEQPLMVLVEGQFPDTYADLDALPGWPSTGEAPDEAPDQGPEAATLLEPAPGQLILVGSAKMFDDAVVRSAQNPLLLRNAVDFLAGSEDLLTIRSKQLTARTLRPVDAGEKLMWRLFVVVLVPVLFMILGVTRLARRRSESARHRRQLKARA